MSLIPVTDPDLSEVFAQVDALRGEMRDFHICQILQVIAPVNIGAARSLVGKIRDPFERVVAGWQVASRTFESSDLVRLTDSLKAVTGELSDEKRDELANLRETVPVLVALSIKNWTAARIALKMMRDDNHFYLGMLILVSQCSGEAEDRAALMNHRREILTDDPQSNSIALQAIDCAMTQDDPMQVKRQNRLDRLQRLIDLNAPGDFLVNEVYLILETGHIAFSMGIIAEHELTDCLDQDRLNEALAIGHARNRDAALSKTHASLISDPERRAHAFAQRYAIRKPFGPKGSN